MYMMGCDVGVGYTRKQNVSTIDTCHGQPGRAGTRRRERRSPECPVECRVISSAAAAGLRGWRREGAVLITEETVAFSLVQCEKKAIQT
jgi:hypothetical protein